MKNQRALIGAWFKHVPFVFVCSEEINDFPAIAKCRTQKVERPGTNHAKVF